MSQWAATSVGGATRSNRPKRRSSSQGQLEAACIKRRLPWPSELDTRYLEHPPVRPLIRLLRVRETSMRPALEPGGRVVMIGWGAVLRPGAIVVIRDPGDRMAFGVKRVA